MANRNMSTDKQAEEVRERMAQLRSELAGDVYQVSKSASAMTDWRYYVRRHPLAAAAAMAAVGYLIVPRKAAQGSEHLAEVAQLLKENKLGAGAPVMKTGGFLSSFVSIAGAAALRIATAYLTERVKSSFQPVQTETEEEDVPATSRPK